MTRLEFDDSGNIMVGQVHNFLEHYTWEGQWEKVIVMYYIFPKQSHKKVFNTLNGTALHVAIDLKKEYVVREVLNAILKHNDEDDSLTVLKMGNERGDTPLHIAASRGFARICKWIIGINNERIDLLSMRNNNGETPLFQAAVNCRINAFVYLSHIFKEIKVKLLHLIRDDVDSLMKDVALDCVKQDLVRDDGDSILHAAIQGEYFDLAMIIVLDYPFLSNHLNIEQSTPLKVLATKPSAFKSASSLSWYKRILYHCIYVELDAEGTMKPYLREMKDNQNSISNEMKLPDTAFYDFINSWLDVSGKDKEKMEQFFNPESLSKLEKHQIGFLPLNYATIQQFVKSAYVHILGLSKKKKQFDPENPSNDNHQPFKSEKYQVGSFPSNYETFRQFVMSAFILGLSTVGVNHVKIAKTKHELSSQLLKELMKTPYESFTGNGEIPTDTEIDPDMYNMYLRSKNGKDEMVDEIDIKDTAFLVAARNGIVEMVTEILKKIPSAIHSTNKKKENALHVAVKYRQPVVVEILKKHAEPEVWNNMVLAVDKDENTILHLAADVLDADKPLQIAGSALQMMWDIKWFQYIKTLVPQHFYFIKNKITSDNQSTSQTPGEIFRSKHTNLISESSSWLKDTSESCSVVAALVAGVSFATASSVPGGTTDEGTPTLEGKPEFDIFTISSLVGLCFSVTGLIMFLTILTSRKQFNDFRRDLPLKLLFGLTSLFVAIASMFVSFCTGHFFLVNHKYKSVIFSLYGVTCVPVTFYAVAQFPLYYDLLTAILTKIPKTTAQGDKL
ncbi:uncharacterized protein [Cicer arietinum]|uniref:Uncharacterized protein LOC101511400 n=1 Tax=Cicer arietinum TaxID=3827 RepID=A0A1S2XLC2_CICAR|nr:uncharacterized protein LOC101511400 [Cicer arietinum]